MSYKAWILLFIIYVAAIGLRFHALASASFSIDELGSIENAAGRGQLHWTLPRGVLLDTPPYAARLENAEPMRHIAASLTQDVHPPLYFIVLRLWENLFGDSDFATRALSALASSLAVLLLFDAGRRLDSTAVGLWSGALMAVAGPQITFAQDARPYALATLMLLVAIDVQLIILKRGATAPLCCAMAVSLIALATTHYFAIAPILALFAVAMLQMRGRARLAVLLTFILSGGVCVVLIFPLLLRQRSNFTDHWMFWFDDEARGQLWRETYRTLQLPIRYITEPPGNSTAFAAASGILLFLPFLLLRRKPALLLPALLLTTTAAMLFALDLIRTTKQIEWIKYTLLAAPGVYLLLPMLFSAGRLRWLMHAVPGAAVLAGIAGLGVAWDAGKPDYRSVAHAVEQHFATGDRLACAGSGYGWRFTGGLYMVVEHYTQHIPHPIVLLDKPASPELMSQLEGHRIWLVIAWPSEKPDVIFPDCTYRFIMADLQSGGGAGLYEVQLKARS